MIAFDFFRVWGPLFLRNIYRLFLLLDVCSVHAQLDCGYLIRGGLPL